MSKNSCISRSTRLLIEALEDRFAPAGGVVADPVMASAPHVRVINEDVPKLTITPGAPNQVLAQIAVSTIGAHEYAQVREIDILNPDVAQDLSNGVNYHVVVNGQTVGYGNYSPDTGTVQMRFYSPLWIRPGQTPHLQLVADASQYFFIGPSSTNADVVNPKFGADVMWVGLTNVQGMPVPDENVSYEGVKPVLHDLATEQLTIYPQWMDKRAATITFGATHVPVYEFNIWAKDAVPTSISFDAAVGKLSDFQGYDLEQHYFGIPVSRTYHGVVANNKVIFTLDADSLQASEFFVYGTKLKPNTDKNFKMEAIGVTAVSAKTFKPLQGVSFNGNGQLRIGYISADGATTYHMVAVAPVVSVKEMGATHRWDSVETKTTVGTSIIIDSFTVSATKDVKMTSFTETTVYGDFRILDNNSISLWESIGNTGVWTQVTGFGWVPQSDPGADHKSMQFQFSNEKIAAGTTVTYRLMAKMVSPTLYGVVGMLEAGLDSANPIAFSDATLPVPFNKVAIDWAFADSYVLPGFEGRG